MTSERPPVSQDHPATAPRRRRRALRFTAMSMPLGDLPERPLNKRKPVLKRRRAKSVPTLTMIHHAVPPHNALRATPQLTRRGPKQVSAEPIHYGSTPSLEVLAKEADTPAPIRIGPRAMRVGSRVFFSSLIAIMMVLGAEWTVAGPAVVFPNLEPVWLKSRDPLVRLAEPRPNDEDTGGAVADATDDAVSGERNDGEAAFILSASAAPTAPVPKARPAAPLTVGTPTRAASTASGVPSPRSNPRRTPSVTLDDPANFEIGSVAPFAVATADDATADHGRRAAVTPLNPISSIPPYRFMRMMSALQDDIARGSQQALEAQSALSRRAAEVFAGAPPETWTETRNVRALLQYALSGAEPRVLGPALSQVPENHGFGTLLDGAEAFNEGRRGDAMRYLGSINMANVDPGVRGSLHLALAALTVGESTDTALAHLADARAIAPGSLVEEAALRRSVLIASETDNAELLLALTDRYLRKFRTSVYAGNFRQRLASALTRMSFIRDVDGFARLDSMLSVMTPGGRTELYLLIARSALEFGEPIAAAAAARRASADAPADSLDAARASLYEAAALVVDSRHSTRARQILDEMNASILPAPDAALRIAALRVAEGVTRLPAPPSRDHAAECQSGPWQLHRHRVRPQPSHGTAWRPLRRACRVAVQRLGSTGRHR